MMTRQLLLKESIQLKSSNKELQSYCYLRYNKMKNACDNGNKSRKHQAFYRFNV